VLLTGLIGVSLFLDLPQVIFLIHVSFGCVVAGQFLAGLE
jgi:hypothetical protein